MTTIPAVPRSDRGPNARRQVVVLLSDDERAEIDRALAAHNGGNYQPIGLGTLLRMLGLGWARGDVALPGGRRSRSRR